MPVIDYFKQKNMVEEVINNFKKFIYCNDINKILMNLNI